MEYGNKLKVLRAIHQLTQEEMGRRLLLSTPVYNRHEKGGKKIKHDETLIERITVEFNVTREWLLDDSNNMITLANEDKPGNINEPSFYNMPKEMMEFFARQQMIMEKILLLIK